MAKGAGYLTQSQYSRQHCCTEMRACATGGQVKSEALPMME